MIHVIGFGEAKGRDVVSKAMRNAATCLHFRWFLAKAAQVHVTGWLGYGKRSDACSKVMGNPLASTVNRPTFAVPRDVDGDASLVEDLLATLYEGGRET